MVDFKVEKHLSKSHFLSPFINMSLLIGKEEFERGDSNYFQYEYITTERRCKAFNQCI